MKKNFGFKKVFALSLATAMVMSSMAFANESKEDTNVDNTVTATPVSENDSTEAEVTADYRTIEGKITSVEAQDDYTRIMIDDGDMGLVLNLQSGAYIVDSKDGSLKTPADLAEGMEVAVVLNAMTPMTMSIPPMVSSAEAVIIKSEGQNVSVLTFDENLVSTDNSLMLNIGENTVIGDVQGTKKAFSADDIKGATAIVVYGATTRSIPAQTTPERVIILKSASEEETAEVSTKSIVDETEAISMVALRQTAENAGFDVEWTSNEDAVVVSNDAVEIKVLCGSNVAEVTKGEETTKVDLTDAVKLEKGTMMVSSDFSQLLK